MAVLVVAAGNPLFAAVHGHPLTDGRDPAPDALFGHSFARPELLREAMTHRSAAPRHGRRGSGSNERLEFMGDRVLGLLIAEWLIERFPQEQEGELGRRLAQLVAQPALAQVAEAIRLTDWLDVAPGEARAGVKLRATVAADALEAAIGALFLDGGLEPARRFVRRVWEQVLFAQAAPPKDPKTTLQEWAQARGLDLPRYTIVARDGPPHAPDFAIEVAVPQHPPATARARSKREAEQAAASLLLAQLGK